MLDTRWWAARGALITRRRQRWQYDRPHGRALSRIFGRFRWSAAFRREREGGGGRAVRHRSALRERHLVGRQPGARVGRDLRRPRRLAPEDAENPRGLRRPIVEPAERGRGPLRRGSGG